MKLVVGIIPPAALECLQAALGEAEIFRLTISEVEVVGSTAAPRDDDSQGPQFRGVHSRGLRVEIAVNDSFLAPALAAFDRARAAGHPLSVRVFAVEEVVRIRTGERGTEAI
jgi:nitrogen regulatory protein PII